MIAEESPKLKTQFAVILDAGSSGTRLHIYRWEKYNTKSPSPPAIDLVYQTVQEEGGFAKCAKDAIDEKKSLETFVEEYFEPLFTNARSVFELINVDTDKVPLLLLGTAGLRDYKLEEEENYTELMEVTKTHLAKQDFKFKEDDRHFGTISGDDEALYGWVAANYSLGFFSRYNERNSKTVGYLEMGGASAQIAFRAQATENDRKFMGEMTTVTVGHYKFDLFLKSHPLGANKAWGKYNEILATGDEERIEDVARPFGLEITKAEKTIIGTLNDDDETLEKLHLDALEVMETLLDGKIKDVFFKEEDDVLRAAIERRPFVGGASFWYSTRGLFGKDPDGNPSKTAFDYREYRREVQDLAILTWDALKDRSKREATREVEKEKKDGDVEERIKEKTEAKMKYWERAWFMAQWINCMLVEGFGIYDEDGRPRGGDGANTDEDKLSFRPYNGPNGGAALNWTLGRIVLLATGDLKTFKKDHGVTPILEKALDDMLRLLEVLREALKTLKDMKKSVDERLKTATGDDKIKLEEKATELARKIEEKKKQMKDTKAGIDKLAPK